MEGVVFTSGRIAYTWTVGPHVTYTFADNIDTLIKLHGHEGNSRIEFYPEDIEEPKKETKKPKKK